MLYKQTIVFPDHLPTPAVEACPAAAIVGGDSLPVVKTAIEAAQRGWITPVFIGPEAAIAGHITALGDDPARFSIQAVQEEAAMGVCGAQLAAHGEVDIVIKGHIHTDLFMRPLVSREHGLRTPGGRFTHIFHMSFPHSTRQLLISDAALNITAEGATGQAILTHLVQCAHALGIATPRIAVLSASEEINPAMPSSRQAADLAAWGQETFEAAICGPLALDNALSPHAASVKNITNPVAGRADALLVPSIEAGNMLYKAMVYLAGACAAGVVMGARVPIVLTSRADPEASRLASIALARLLSTTAHVTAHVAGD